MQDDGVGWQQEAVHDLGQVLEEHRVRVEDLSTHDEQGVGEASWTQRT